ncbi:MAG: flagellar protein FlgN [Phycisphaerales bacterium]
MPDATASRQSNPTIEIESWRLWFDEMIDAHEALHRALEVKRDAMRRADAPALADAAQREYSVLERIEALDRRRLELLDAAGISVEGTGAVRTLLARIPEPDATELSERRGRLRGLIEETQSAGEAIRQAADTLRAHVSGIVQRVQFMLNQTGLYGRDGRVGATPAAVSTIDFRE